MTTEYVVLTPAGSFTAAWDDGDSPVVYAGSEAGIAFFRRFMSDEAVTGHGGVVLDPERLEPADLFGFCQSEQHGVLVLPEAEDLESIIRNEEMGDE